jgi:hypothetical protein
MGFILYKKVCMFVLIDFLGVSWAVVFVDCVELV